MLTDIVSKVRIRLGLAGVMDWRNFCWGSKVGAWGWNSEISEWEGKAQVGSLGDFIPEAEAF